MHYIEIPVCDKKCKIFTYILFSVYQDNIHNCYGMLIGSHVICQMVKLFPMLDSIQAKLKTTAKLNNVQGGQKNLAQVFLHALTLSNINRFTKLFHCQNQKNICNNTITKNPTISQVCCYTIL